MANMGQYLDLEWGSNQHEPQQQTVEPGHRLRAPLFALTEQQPTWCARIRHNGQQLKYVAM